MIYELRKYTAQPGRLRDLLARFENHTNRIWARYGIRQVGFWTTIVGPTDGLSYLLAWESFAEREEKWNAFRADPELLEAFAESEKNGPLVFNVENLLLQPTSFSGVTRRLAETRSLSAAARQVSVSRKSRKVQSRIA